MAGKKRPRPKGPKPKGRRPAAQKRWQRYRPPTVDEIAREPGDTGDTGDRGGTPTPEAEADDGASPGSTATAFAPTHGLPASYEPLVRADDFAELLADLRAETGSTQVVEVWFNLSHVTVWTPPPAGERFAPGTPTTVWSSAGRS